jgi:hypothetical protein
MLWEEGQGQAQWVNRLAEIRLDDVVMVRGANATVAGRWMVWVMLRTMPATEVMVDGTLDDWWHKYDVRARERWGIEDD